jgi:predicted ArsR family transcriptional regulator
MLEEPELSLLARRRVEGEILKPVYEALRERLGEAAAREILSLAIKRTARATGQKLALEMGGGDLANLIALQPLWQKGQALTVEVLAQDAARFDYNVTHCAYAAMYRQIGLGEMGFLLSCNRDEAFIEGFAPNIELTRTQTLMEGAPFCDFRYRIRAGS